MQTIIRSPSLKSLSCSAAALAAALAWPVLAGAQANLLTPPPAAPAAAQPAPVAAPPAAPPRAAPNALNESVAAVINDDIISTYDLQQRMRLLVLTSGVQPTEQALEQLQQEALRSLTDERLEMQELQRIQQKQKDKSQKDTLIANDKEVEDEVTNLAKQNNLTLAQLKTSFAAAGVDINSLRAQIRAQISWQRLVGGMYGSRIRVGDDQVSSALQRLSAAATQPQYHIAEIFLDANRAGGQAQAVAGAEQLIAQLQKGAPFPAVARQFSAAPTSANGGDAGWVSASQEPPEVAKALETLRPSQLSAPIEVPDGVYVIYLVDKQAASSQTLVNLKQLAIRLPKDAPANEVAAASATLVSLRAQAKGCANFDTLASKAKGVVAADLGEAEITDLSGPFKTAAETLQPDQLSEPIRTDVGLHLVAVCSKRSGGANMPSRVQLHNQLEAEQLAVMSRRYLRDLRTSADIETR